MAPSSRVSLSRSADTHEFTATLEVLSFGRMKYLVIFLPESLQALPAFAGRKRLRMKSSVGGHPLQRAWQSLGDGRRYAMLGSAFCRKAGLSVGDVVTVQFSLIEDDQVEVPAEIREVLRQESRWRTLWKALTPGKQRGLAHYVESARGLETRASRVVEVMEKLEAGVPLGPPRRR
jgi:hypothetical protein